MILGTVGYMSPEQVRGARVDARTDIFALGAVLFELLSGRRAFHRDTAAETMTAVLKEDVPELTSRGSQVPPPLDRIVRCCLEKNPDERMQSARDVAIALDAFSGSDVSSARGVVQPPAVRKRWPHVAVGVALLGAGTAAGFLGGRTSAPSPAPSEIRAIDSSPSAAVKFAAPASRRTVRASSTVPCGTVSLSVYLPVRLDNPRSAGPPVIDAMLLAVSRSGDMAIATKPERRDIFVESGLLAQIPLSGGAPREVLEHVTHAAFGPEDRVAVVRTEAGRTRLEFPIGTVLYESAGWISWPRFSPAGDRIAFHEHPLHHDDRGWTSIVDVATRAKRNLMPEQETLQGLAWTPDGREVCFASANRLRCVGIDSPAIRVVLAGAPRLVLHDIAPDGRMLASTAHFRTGLVAGQTGGRERDLPGRTSAFQSISAPTEAVFCLLTWATAFCCGRSMAARQCGSGAASRPVSQPMVDTPSHWFQEPRHASTSYRSGRARCGRCRAVLSRPIRGQRGCTMADGSSFQEPSRDALRGSMLRASMGAIRGRLRAKASA